MSSGLLDRIDPKPPGRVYRWDLDRTYLRTEVETLGQIVRTALESAEEKVNVPGAPALMRELRGGGQNHICIVSGSPTQMRRVVEDKLRLDRVEWDELVLKPSVTALLRGRLKSVRGQLGFKLAALLSSRIGLKWVVPEVLFGDDAESDAFIYSLYADVLAGRVEPERLERILHQAELYEDERQKILELAGRLEKAESVTRIFIHLDRLTPPERFAPYGRRVVPVYNYFQAAMILMGEGHLSATSALKVVAEMVHQHGYGLPSLTRSLQDMLQRGLPFGDLAAVLSEAVSSDGALLRALKATPDLVSGLMKRATSLGSSPEAASLAPPVDYLALLDDARPRREKRKPKDESES